MKNRIDNIKRQAGDESKKALMVVLGFASGAAIAKGMDMLSEKFPQAEPFVKYARPVILSGGGFLISAAASNEEKALKHFGYGLVASGAFEGLKLIPIAKEYLSLSGVNDMPTTYYTENSSNLELGSFGLNAIPIGSFTMEDAPSFSINLPSLDNETNFSGNNSFGYNGDTTGDADRIKGII
jgi:hypothetical protein